MSKSFNLGALAACLLVTGGPLLAKNTSEFGWIGAITNDTNYALEVQSSDNGFRNSIMGESACVAGTKQNFFEVGCNMFVVPPKTTMKVKNFVVPYESQKGQINFTLLKVSSGNEPDPMKWALQERNSKVTLIINNAVGNSWQRDGNCYYTVTVTNSMLSLTPGSKPGWY